MTLFHASQWSVLRLSGIENLSEAVHGAGLNAVQLSATPVTASLAFTERRSIRFTTGIIDNQVSLSGPLSEDMITLGLGIDLPPGTRHWLNDVTSGNVGVFMPGDEHDALYAPGSLYAVLSLSGDVLEEEAAQRELVLTPKELGGSGIHGQRLAASQLALIKNLFQSIHAPLGDGAVSRMDPAAYFLNALVEHVGRPPRASIGVLDPRGHERIVRRARAFIHENLGSPLSVERIATAAATSPRTLHRAFQMLLDETPYSYVLKLRLHRIRYDVISDTERTTTLATIANHWGISELGRLSGWYRELFGELPSQTRRRLAREGDPPRLH
ncbi:helix-turn-helix- domain containing protein AraC type [Xanthobacter versatilis]|uniref:Helix-turn-helix-domain containing protein AraC type n=1 Tax=Xanthobacter autotrophicus (strain ATCC BAA-1158 / Py2) TaxID=78245 RepID=A7ICV7_XANP2|nr:helix-turn-helix- domain containing protein AraC type [Xanthobacter autotrophicus Py2]